MKFVLASASPARQVVLGAAGIDAAVIVSGVDESVIDSPQPEVLCGTLARMKALAVAARIQTSADSGRVLVLGCDSVLAFDGQVLGKPDSAEDARKRWHAMRGREGVLHTGHCLIDLRVGSEPDAVEEVASTKVRFADLSDAEIEAYIATGEPLSVAGAFTIDGLGGPFVESIEGDPSTVIGLSLPALRRLLARLDLTVMSLWRNR
jgi:septum formation protein